MYLTYRPIHEKYARMWHGGDYNPEQWRDTPHIWKEDMRLAKLAHCNTMTVGVFSWTSLEPREGQYEFAWLDQVMDMLADNGMYAILATPSGARPAWLSAEHKEVLRVSSRRERQLHGGRHNHCFTSPLYREKVRQMNTQLAKRYGQHDALLLWHLSNEYSGDCHCDLCQAAFRKWLATRYRDDLDALNRACWTSFWSHTYTDWSQIESPSEIGEQSLHGLNLDWKRFVTDQTVDFMRCEMEPLRLHAPDIKVTTNMMGTFPGLDYWKLAAAVDVVSWDSYPWWHGPQPDWVLASQVAFVHDINRSLKGGQPFLLMESTPSMTNWQQVSKLKRPGMHVLSSLQAIAHGSDSVQYFQWRKSRGSSEKFHGAVVDHVGHEHTRVFKDVAQVGELLEQLDAVVGTCVPSEVAIVYDWENRWAIDDAMGPRRSGRDYEPTCAAHYRAFWQQGVPVDVIDMTCDLSAYKLVVAPMQYMLRGDIAQRIEQFVQQGGVFVSTYWSGLVDEHDLCFLGGFPGPLRRVLGVWVEETDALYDGESNQLVMEPNTGWDLRPSYEVRQLCDLIHTESAHTLALYGDDFYAGRPALTVNDFGDGQAYYIAARTTDDFLADFYRELVARVAPRKALDALLPQGVSAAVRTDGETDFIFLMNFTSEAHPVTLGRSQKLLRALDDGEPVGETVTVAPFEVQILFG